MIVLMLLRYPYVGGDRYFSIDVMLGSIKDKLKSFNSICYGCNLLVFGFNFRENKDTQKKNYSENIRKVNQKQTQGLEKRNKLSKSSSKEHSSKTIKTKINYNVGDRENGEDSVSTSPIKIFSSIPSTKLAYSSVISTFKSSENTILSKSSQFSTFIISATPIIPLTNTPSQLLTSYILSSMLLTTTQRSEKSSSPMLSSEFKSIFSSTNGQPPLNTSLIPTLTTVPSSSVVLTSISISRLTSLLTLSSLTSTIVPSSSIPPTSISTSGITSLLTSSSATTTILPSSSIVPTSISTSGITSLLSSSIVVTTAFLSSSILSSSIAPLVCDLCPSLFTQDGNKRCQNIYGIIETPRGFSSIKILKYAGNAFSSILYTARCLSNSTLDE
ncbi:hypothetical protein HZS_2466, partial [Henneguya salminicola]